MTESFPPILTREGHQLQVRFLTRNDGDLLVELFRHLSPETRYQRFHIPVDDLSPEEIAAQLPNFTSVDRQNHVALIAVQVAGEQERPIGVARFRRRPGAEEAEVAVVVRDDWQRQGVGTALLERLAGVARELGIRRFVAWIQASNRAVLNLLARLKLPTETHTSLGAVQLIIQLGERAAR